MSNTGLLVEDEIVNALNKKRYKHLNNNMRNFIRDIYGVVNERDKIYCEKTNDYIKPDIVIKIKNRTRYVSIKSGRASIMHDEIIKNVILFFRELGVSEYSQKLLLFYQYGDGTLNGSGKYRRDYHETYTWLESGIKKFNEEMNLDHTLVEKIIERVMFQGVNNEAPRADYIYQGDLSYGIVVSREQILKHLRNKTFNFYENVHIGPLLFRPHARYAKTVVKNEKLRNRIEFYWPNFHEDMVYIYKRYNKTFRND